MTRILVGLTLVAIAIALVSMVVDPAFAQKVGPCAVCGAPGPIAGAGLPFLAIGYGAYWLVKRFRSKTD